jgi:hypothetical protein
VQKAKSVKSPSLVLLVAIFCGLTSSALAQSEAHFAPFGEPEARSLELLRSAQQSVDVAQYNIRNERFVVVLRELRTRGVAIRVVVDAKNAKNPWNTLDDTIEAEGFQLVRYENTRHRYAIMHHKFAVIDGQKVLTGSFNWNQTAQLVNDENLVVVDDPALVGAYSHEFRELWGEIPGQSGGASSAAGEVLFAPHDRPRQAVIDAVQSAQRSIRVAMFSFKDRDVANALRAAALRGVEVTLLVEKKQADTTGADERVAGGGARVIVGANTATAYSAMHHKFAIIDDTTVITGACNWTYTAFTHSNEDLLFLHSASLARRYTDAFAALVRRYDPAGYDPADFGVARSHASVHFLVRMPYTAPGDRLFVTGDAPELGSWDPAAGVELATSSSVFPTWSGRVRLPTAGAQRYKAVILRADGSVRWELGADRPLPLDAAGTDGVAEATFRDRVSVSFKSTLALASGEELRLVGAATELGSWDPLLAPAFVLDVATGMHTLTLELPGRAYIGCKLVVIAADGTPTWETGFDRWPWIGEAPQQAVDLIDR